MGEVAEELVVRELSREEFVHLAKVPPFDEIGLGRGDWDRVAVMGVFRGDKLVGYWMLYDAVHVEPLWVAPEERKNPRLVRQLWGKVAEKLVESGTPMAYATIGDAALELNAPMAMRLGFKPLPTNLFYLVVNKE